MATRVLVTGATGQLGPYVVEHLAALGHSCVPWSRKRTVEIVPGLFSQPVPLEDARLVEQGWRQAQPDVVIHMAAMARIDECFRNPQQARLINVGATDHLVRLAQASSAPFLYISTDLVFDGTKGNYTEDDPPASLSVYGRTKREAEDIVLAYEKGAVFRVALLYGPGRHGVRTFLDRAIESWQGGRPVELFVDEWRSPLALPDAAAAIGHWLRLLAGGLWHIGGPERMNRYEMGCRAADVLGFSRALCVPTTRDSWHGPEPRPADVSLDSSRWRTRCPEWAPDSLEANVRRLWPSL